MFINGLLNIVKGKVEIATNSRSSILDDVKKCKIRAEPAFLW